MMAYSISIWASIFFSDITVAVFTYPKRLPESWMWYPAAPFVRSNYLLIDPCTWDSCLGDYELAPKEFHEMIRNMYFDAVFYLIVALYLNQVVP